MDWVDLPGLEMEVLGDLPGLEGSVLGEVTRCSNSDTVAQKLSKLSTVADPRTPVKWREVKWEVMDGLTKYLKTDSQTELSMGKICEILS